MRALGFALVAASTVVAAADWVAVARGNKRAEYVLKPGALAVLFLGALFLKPTGPAVGWTMYGPLPRSPGTAVWVFTLVALGLSLAGDVFLMLPQDLFVAGLGSFLLAHVAYVVAFNRTAPPEPLTAVATVAVAAVAVPLFLRMRRGMLDKGQGEFQAPVAVYVLAIGAMVVSAVATAGRSGWPAGNSAAAIAGALLFMASDSMIGWSRFVEDFPRSGLAIIVTYHLGQALLVLGLLG